jgi:hypothetical protein
VWALHSYDVPRFDVFAGYYQFWLADELATKATGKGVEWTEEAVYDTRVAVAPGIVAVSTTRYGFIPVEVVVTADRLELDPAAWDHVVEASLDVASGVVLVEDAGDVLVAPGTYRVCVCLRGLSDPFARQPQDGDDEALVVLWPAPESGVRVLRQYQTPRRGPA